MPCHSSSVEDSLCSSNICDVCYVSVVVQLRRPASVNFNLTGNHAVIAPALVRTQQFVNSFARRQHLFDITTKPVDVDSNFVLYPARLSLLLFRRNVTI